MELNISLAEVCDHSPEKWSVKAVPSKAGPRFLLSVQTITCKCGAVANLTDARGVRSPSTVVGVDFLLAAPQAATPPKPKPSAQPLVETQTPPEAPPAEGPGTEMSVELQRLGIPKCQACQQLAARMNEWGPQGCRERMDAIVADVLPRARAWFDHATVKEKLSVWWNSNQKLSTALAVGTKASSWELDDALKEVIRVQALAAIDRFEQKGNTL